jgi:hypothetical protein
MLNLAIKGAESVMAPVITFYLEQYPNGDVSLMAERNGVVSSLLEISATSGTISRSTSVNPHLGLVLAKYGQLAIE